MAELNTPPPIDPDIQALVGQQVVIDTDSSFVYIGLLVKVGREFLTVSDVDVHETADSKSTKEQYAHDARRLGSRSNRQVTYIRMARVLSISKLDDIVQF